MIKTQKKKKKHAYIFPCQRPASVGRTRGETDMCRHDSKEDKLRQCQPTNAECIVRVGYITLEPLSCQGKIRRDTHHTPTSQTTATTSPRAQPDKGSKRNTKIGSNAPSTRGPGG